MSELLQIKNIMVNCKPDTKENTIRKVGQLLVDSEYVNPHYIDAMLKREESFSTYLGNGLAIPHGIEESKKDIMSSGIAVLIVPEGVNWDGEKAQIIIGIAGVGDEHIDILTLIAERMMEPDIIERLIKCSAKEIYQMFNC